MLVGKFCAISNFIPAGCEAACKFGPFNGSIYMLHQQTLTLLPFWACSCLALAKHELSRVNASVIVVDMVHTVFCTGI